MITIHPFFKKKGFLAFKYKELKQSAEACSQSSE